MTAPTAPRIQIDEAGVFATLASIGRVDLEPSSKAYRKRRCFWLARQGRRVLSRWCLTPGLALAAALKAERAVSTLEPPESHP